VCRLRGGRRSRGDHDIRPGEGILFLLQRGPRRPRAATRRATPLLQGAARRSRTALEDESAMSRWRLLLVAVLLAAPLGAMAILGSVYLWREHLWRYAWWPLAACMALGYYLAWHWQRRRKLLPMPEATPPMHWTERDRQAWELVESRAEAAAKTQPDKF